MILLFLEKFQPWTHFLNFNSLSWAFKFAITKIPNVKRKQRKKWEFDNLHSVQNDPAGFLSSFEGLLFIKILQSKIKSWIFWGD